MRRFIKSYLFFCLPFIVLGGYYVILDPFKVIKHYEMYYQPDDFVSLNRGFVSTMHYINHKDTFHYDSFIFGSSRSIAYYEEEWKKYIPKTSVCYHFDESGGSVGSLYYKIKYIHEHGEHIRNALILCDFQSLSQTESEGILFTCPPILKENKDLLKFHKEFFLAFYDINFFRVYIDYKIHKEYKPEMGWYFNNPKGRMGYNPINNELNWNKQEESIAKGLYYNDERMKMFENAQFPGKIAGNALDDERKGMFREIKTVFELQKTNYRIIISPGFDQIKINPDDLQFLTDLFGKDNVYDFSGPNRWNADFHNYYETSHYRPCVANEIMSIVYDKNF